MSIEAMKMALEALENIDRWLSTIGQKGLRDYEADAIQALRQAIEQAEKRNCDNCESLRLAGLDRIKELEDKLLEREWVGLTDEEIGTLTVFDGLHHFETPLLADFARAIEAKLKEKNG